MNKAIEKQILQIYHEVFNKVFTRKAITSLSSGSKLEAKKNIRRLKTSKEYAKFCEMFAKELAKKGLASQRGIWRKYYAAAKATGQAVLPPTFKAYEYQVFSKAVKSNFEMIKSIPDSIMNVLQHKYTSVLIEEVAKGSIGRGSFEKVLKQHGHKNAKLIARTETAKLQTVILEHRATELGSIVYLWRASNDKRTRLSHRQMNNVIVFWNFSKPILDGMQGHAGEFPNCRCTPQPIMDKDDLTNSNYKVYDYNQHKIVSMTKRELLKAIEVGHL